jgi:hypothetical protein
VSEVERGRGQVCEREKERLSARTQYSGNMCVCEREKGFENEKTHTHTKRTKRRKKRWLGCVCSALTFKHDGVVCTSSQLIAGPYTYTPPARLCMKIYIFLYHHIGEHVYMYVCVCALANE